MCYHSGIMASAAQIEAFAWWLAQDRDGRKAASIADHFGIPADTAEKWRSSFGRELARVAGETVETRLRQYRAEYEVLQSRTIGVLPKLIDAIESNARIIAETAENGGPVDPGLIAGTASALKTVYSLAEAASGADVAKRRASQKPGDGKGGDKLGLPDFSSLFHLGGEVDSNPGAPAIEAEAVTILENPNENPLGPSASEEK